MLSHFALVDTGNLSLSSEEANGIMGKTSRIIKENAGINSIRKKYNFVQGSCLTSHILHLVSNLGKVISFWYLLTVFCLCLEKAVHAVINDLIASMCTLIF